VGHPSSPNASPIVPQAQETPPEVELVVAGPDGATDTPHTRVRFMRTTPHGLTVTSTVSVPGTITALTWIGPGPVVLLDDGEIGHLAATGYERFPEVPPAMWPVKSSPGDPSVTLEQLDPPRWRMIVDTTGSLWQARCDWRSADHGIARHCLPEDDGCDAWLYARVWPGALTISGTEPKVSFDSENPASHVPLPSVPPSGAIKTEIVDTATPGWSVLRCTDGSTTIQYPPSDDEHDPRSRDGVDELTWLSATPPIFLVTRLVGCRGDPYSVIFEGCKPSERFGEVSGGPKDLIVLRGADTLSLRWHDHGLGSLDGVSLFAFAPTH
jgi:hypothetical protein